MSKKAVETITPFVEEHPSTLIADLLQLLSQRGSAGIDEAIVSAYLLRVANCDGVPDPIRTIAMQIYKDWDLEAVSASASAILTLGGMLH
ncbi:MAG: hypothetical protein AB7G13_04300 [Lautropia sp.]